MSSLLYSVLVQMPLAAKKSHGRGQNPQQEREPVVSGDFRVAIAESQKIKLNIARKSLKVFKVFEIFNDNVLDHIEACTPSQRFCLHAGYVGYAKVLKRDHFFCGTP